MHPSEGIRCAKDDHLEGKRIVLGITGSIAAVESFDLIRELIRHGAEVHAVMSDEATKFITPQTISFATGNETITGLDWRTQHISLLGDPQDHVDLYLIAPCTANTLSKMALGVCDTPVTIMGLTAIGSRIPVLIAPAMHFSMFQHPAVQKAISDLGPMGVQIIGPRIEGTKVRIASTEEIVEACLRRLSKGTLVSKRVLVIGGGTEEPIDDVRTISNNSTGETAVAIATSAYERGADVELWMGRCSVALPSYMEIKRFRTVDDLSKMVTEVHADIVIVPAALSDYAPVKKCGKISSRNENLHLDLTLLPKILPQLRGRAQVLVGFKAEHTVEADELLERARARMAEYKADIMVANDLRDVSSKGTKALFDQKKRCTIDRWN